MRDPTDRARKEGHQAAFLSRREERSSGGETHTTTDLDELKKHHKFLREDDDDDDKKEEEETGTRRGRGEEEEAMLSLEKRRENEWRKKTRENCSKSTRSGFVPMGHPRRRRGTGERRKKSREAKAWIFAALKRCSERKNLGTFELNFRYKEGEKGSEERAGEGGRLPRAKRR